MGKVSKRTEEWISSDDWLEFKKPHICLCENSGYFAWMIMNEHSDFNNLAWRFMEKLNKKRESES